MSGTEYDGFYTAVENMKRLNAENDKMLLERIRKRNAKIAKNMRASFDKCNDPDRIKRALDEAGKKMPPMPKVKESTNWWNVGIGIAGISLLAAAIYVAVVND